MFHLGVKAKQTKQKQKKPPALKYLQFSTHKRKTCIHVRTLFKNSILVLVTIWGGVITN